jgi:hypothetical protein
LENNDLVTKADLAAAVDSLKSEMASKADLAELRDALTEQMRDMQTEILKAFLPFREQVTNREAAMEVRQNSLDARQGIIENRLWEIEKRLLIDPPKPH